MNNPITNLKQGATIKGKWHNKTYRIVRQLGHGAIGVVYLAIYQQKYVAIKISEQSSSITTEVNVLKAFAKVQGKQLGPSLLDVDDWVRPSSTYSFYVMEYLQGIELNVFLKHKGYEWISILLIQLLDDLEHLHKAGWVFGDLKPENLIVTQKPTRLRWIDVGGTTQHGRAVKEYTEFYDRGYWGLGSRKAEPSYDLFAVAMIIIQVFYPKRFEKGPTPAKTLKYRINQHSRLRTYSPILNKAIEGQYNSSKEMKQDLTKILLAHQKRAQNQVDHKQKAVKKRSQDPPKWTESLGIATVCAVFLMVFFIINLI
jgi:serine/threonine protein kinase